MSDYGHPLRFGVFITPAHGTSSEAAPAALAVVAEEAGLDLVTFQDHPYQPSFHDTWTLLTWVAARTERVQLAGNVLNLPLRPPAVLARAAASLDLLSGGRVALGLGSGAFWDAIEAMGGPRRTPAESVDALAEAISASTPASTPRNEPNHPAVVSPSVTESKNHSRSRTRDPTKTRTVARVGTSPARSPS